MDGIIDVKRAVVMGSACLGQATITQHRASEASWLHQFDNRDAFTRYCRVLVGGITSGSAPNRSRKRKSHKRRVFVAPQSYALS